MRRPPPRRPKLPAILALALAAGAFSACRPATAPTTAAAPQADRRIPLLVDVDMGLDDARVLLALTRQDRFRVEAVTTVVGCAAAGRGAENALRLLEAAGVRGIPVAAGAERPLGGEVPVPPWRKLSEELGDLRLPPASWTVERGGGVRLLRRRLSGASTPRLVLALGPVTNLALALSEEPTLRGRIAAVYLLGDFWTCQGFNCRTDPEAARILRESRVPLYMVTRSATDSVPFDAKLLDRVRDLPGPLPPLIVSMMRRHVSPSLKLWDDAVLAGLLDPSLLQFKALAPDVRQAVELDAPRLRRLLFDLWARAAPFRR